MAKFLDTQAISNELMKLIKEAKDKIILVSPYLKVNTQIQERLKTKSKIGTLSEIVIVYGKSELKESELAWIKEVEDLKVYEKNNLHAKCYISEDKAIICSMNLYDYSQQNNIEMGVLISKQSDPEAYGELMEEINNIKVNGTRKRFNEAEKSDPVEQKRIEKEILNSKSIASSSVKLTPLQQLKFEILKEWRLQKSREEKSKAFLILTDNEIRAIVTHEKLDSKNIYDLIAKKSAIKYSEQILSCMKGASYYTIGRVVNVWYQDNPTAYDRVKFKDIHTNEEKWYDTTQEVPIPNSLVAVKLNRTWFNDYVYLKEE